MSTIGVIQHATDNGEEEVSSRPPLREVRSHSDPRGVAPIKQTQKQKNELLEQLVKFRMAAEAKRTEMLVLKYMR